MAGTGAGTWLGRLESWSPEEAFAWLLCGLKPVTCSDFLRDHWEPLDMPWTPWKSWHLKISAISIDFLSEKMEKTYFSKAS